MDEVTLRKKYAKLLDEVTHLRAVNLRAIEMLDGNDDEPCPSSVAGSELIRKMREHLDAYWELEDEVTIVATGASIAS